MIEETKFKAPNTFIDPFSKTKLKDIVWISKLLYNKFQKSYYYCFVKRIELETGFYYLFGCADSKKHLGIDKITCKYKDKNYLIKKIKKGHYK